MPFRGSMGRVALRGAVIVLVGALAPFGCGSPSLPNGQSAKSPTAERGPKIDFLTPQAIGNPPGEEPPWITHLTVIDLDRDGLLDVLVCDARSETVNLIAQSPKGTYTEQALGDTIAGPAHVTPCDIDQDGDTDLLVAKMGNIFPTSDYIGGVVVLENDGQQNFTNRDLLERVARVTDIQPGDFDGDGDIDLVVGQFGYEIGEIRWLENQGDWKFKTHYLLNLSGTIHTPVADIDSDGDLDIVALVSQEWEEIYVFENDGKGAFTSKILYGAGNEDFGSSSLSLVDLDQDDDLDILYTNGDSFDYLPPGPRPWHGIQWLENKGALNFDYHRIDDFSGAASAVGVDLDQDQDLDIVIVDSLGQSPDSANGSIAWYENDGRMNFTRRPIADDPSHLLVIAAGDMDGDGQVDLVTGGMYAFPPYDRLSRVHLWNNDWRGVSAGGAEQ